MAPRRRPTASGPPWWPGGFEVEDEEVDTELGDLFYGFDLDQKEFLVSDGERTVRLSLCRLDRHNSPVVMEIGPVMSIEDLVAAKAAALVNRRQVRGLEPTDILEAGRFLDRLDDNRFTYYGLSADEIAFLRRQLAAWPR
jgi:hypothetical protein